MSDHDHEQTSRGVSRRKVLECMTWAGTGVLWTISGGVPRSLGIIDEAMAQNAGSLTLLPIIPSFMIHTGDITHLSKPSEFDDADRIVSQARLDVHYVPGEHDVIDQEVKLYRERYGR